MLQPLPAASVAHLKDEKGGFAARGKTGPKEPRSTSKCREGQVIEGAISCLHFGEKCLDVPDPELFIGFESGAVGMFRIFITNNKKTKALSIQSVKMFSCQKVIQDIKVRHVLSFSSLHIGNKKETEDFTLAIGYYASLMQTISFVSGYEQDSYTMID